MATEQEEIEKAAERLYSTKDPIRDAAKQVMLKKAFKQGWEAAIHFQEEKQTDLSKRMDAFLDQNLPKKVSDYVEIFAWLSEKDYLSDKMEYIMEEYEHTKQ